MGWSIGYDSNWQRDIGYGVPAYCDHPGCKEEIDRGLSYVCGGDTYGGEKGCGLYFCAEHLSYYNKRVDGRIKAIPLCDRCGHNRKPYKPTEEHPEWLKFKMTDPTWKQWRVENGYEKSL